MDKWDNKTIELHRLTGTDPRWLNAHASVPHAVFTLHRQDDIPGNGHCEHPRYELSFDQCDMNEFWRGVWLVEMQGTAPTPVVSGLPEWKNGGPDHEKKWAAGVDPIAAHLQTEQTTYTHLQGYMSVITPSGNPSVDRVRMMYLDQAITCNDGTKKDLVIVALKYADGSSVHEDGAGSGPPR